MAQRVQVELVDDLNGDVADETVRFGVDGTEYEIDLTTENAEKLRSALSEYVEKGRKAKVGRRGQGGQSSASSPSKSKREETRRRVSPSEKRPRRSVNGRRRTGTTPVPADASPRRSSTPTTTPPRTSSAADQGGD